MKILQLWSGNAMPLTSSDLEKVHVISLSAICEDYIALLEELSLLGKKGFMLS